MKHKYSLALLGANILFGVDFALYTSITEQFIDYRLLFVLVVASSALFFIPLIIRRRYLPRTTIEIYQICIATMLMVFGREYFNIKGSQFTSALDASTLATTAPIFTLAFSAIVQKERIHISKIIGMSLVLIGSMVLFFHTFPHQQEQKQTILGNIFILTAVFAAATNTIIIKPVMMRHSFRLVLGWCYLLGAILTIPSMAFDVDWSELVGLPQKGVIQIGFLLIFGTALPIYLLYYGVERLTSVHTALYFYLQPLTATLLGVLLGTFKFRSTNIFSLILIAIGICIVAFAYRKYGFAPLLKNRDKRE